MAPIAAAHVKGWTVFSGPSETGGKICVEINMRDTVYEDTESIHNVHAHTFETALTAVLFQATKTLEPDNWVECPNLTQDGTGSLVCVWTASNTSQIECPDCDGTGKAMREIDSQCG